MNSLSGCDRFALMSNFPNPSNSSISSQSRRKDVQAKDDSYISTKRSLDRRLARVQKKDETKQEYDISAAMKDSTDTTGAPLTSSTIGAVSTDGVTVDETDFSSSSSSKRNSSVRFRASPIGSSSSSTKASNTSNSIKAPSKPVLAPTQTQLERGGSIDNMRSIVRSAARRLSELDEEEEEEKEVPRYDVDEGGYLDEGGYYDGEGFESSASASPNESKRTKREDA